MNKLSTLIDKCKRFATRKWRENVIDEPVPNILLSLYPGGHVRVEQISGTRIEWGHIEGVLEWMRREMQGTMQELAIDALKSAHRQVAQATPPNLVRGPWLN